MVAQRRWLPGAAGRACGAGLLLRARGGDGLRRSMQEGPPADAEGGGREMSGHELPLKKIDS